MTVNECFYIAIAVPTRFKYGLFFITEACSGYLVIIVSVTYLNSFTYAQSHIFRGRRLVFWYEKRDAA